MSTITNLQSTDNGASSLTTINTNFGNLNTDKLEISVISTDTSLGTSDVLVPSQKAVKTYADTKITANGAITGAIKTKITYDAKGLVTAGADATTADITDSTDKRYCTDAQKTVIGNTSGSNTGDQTGGTPALTLGTANTAGNATTFIRTNDTILAFDATAPSTQAFGDAAAAGTATVAARRDHKHAMPASPTISDATISITDITTNNVSITAHGFVPKAPNSTSQFLRGDGSWATPAGSGDVAGPASSTDNAVVRFDSTTGKLLQNSAVTIADTTGDITGGKYNKITVTAPAAGATLTIADGATLSAPSSATVSGTNTGDNTVATALTGTPSVTVNAVTTTGNIELGHASDTTIARVSAGVVSIEGVNIDTISATNTLTNKRITKRTGSTTSSATPTINTDNVDMYLLTAQAADITSFTTNLSGTPTEGQLLWISVTGTAARALSFGTSFEASTVSLPTTTVTTARLDMGFVWNSVSNKWRIIASA